MTNIIQFPGKQEPKPPDSSEPVLFVTLQRMVEGALIARYVAHDEEAAAVLFAMATALFHEREYCIWFTQKEVERYGDYVDLGNSQKCKDGFVRLQLLAVEGRL